LNFLEICQMAARETQVVEDGLPETTINQVGILGSIVKWVNDSWKRLQLKRPRWKWMRRRWTATSATTVDLARYSASALGITRFSRWITDTRRSDGSVYQPLTMYLEATGISDEGPLQFIEWDIYVERYLRGSVDSNRPIEWSIDPQTRDLMLGPPPNDAFILKGECVVSPQVLDGDDDEPELPEDFHELIAWLAVERAQNADEATPQAIQTAMDQVKEIGRLLDREQNDPYTIGGDPIA